jgi:hypothetical protein
MQRMYDWRAHLGKAGLDAVEAIWASDPRYESAEERKALFDFSLESGLQFVTDY